MNNPDFTNEELRKLDPAYEYARSRPATDVEEMRMKWNISDQLMRKFMSFLLRKNYIEAIDYAMGKIVLTKGGMNFRVLTGEQFKTKVPLPASTFEPAKKDKKSPTWMDIIWVPLTFFALNAVIKECNSHNRNSKLKDSIEQVIQDTRSRVDSLQKNLPPIQHDSH